jgi:hypothetical protein
MIEIEYSEHGWKRSQDRDANGKTRTVDKQTVWKRLDEDEWARVDLVRVVSNGYSQAPVYVEDAYLLRELLPNGHFRSSNQLANFHATVILRPDERVRNTARPEPQAAKETAGTRYIAMMYKRP